MARTKKVNLIADLEKSEKYQKLRDSLVNQVSDSNGNIQE